MLTLGLVFGTNDKNKVNFELLTSIAKNFQLSPILRGYSLIKNLELLFENSRNIQQKQKEEETKAIFAFENITKLIMPIKNELGALRECMIKVYSKVFLEFANKFALNNNIALIGILGQQNRDLINSDCTLFNLTLEELEKLQNSNLVEKNEILAVLYKGCDIILEKSFRAGEIIAILIFNTLFKVLSEKKYNEHDISVIEEMLKRFISNFTPKQKIRLIESYQKICSSLKAEKNELLITEYLSNDYSRNFKPHEEYKGQFPETHGRNNESLRKKENGGEYNIKNEIREKLKELFVNMKKNLDSNIRIEASEIAESLKSIHNISDHVFYETLNDFAFNTNPRERNTANIWKLLSKAVSIASILNHEQRNKLNENIDWIIQNGKRAYK